MNNITIHAVCQVFLEFFKAAKFSNVCWPFGKKKGEQQCSPWLDLAYFADSTGDMRIHPPPKIWMTMLDEFGAVSSTPLNALPSDDTTSTVSPG